MHYCFRSTTAFKAVGNRATTRKKPYRSSGPLRSPRARTRGHGNGSTSGSSRGNRQDARFLGATVAAIAVGAAPGNGVTGNEPDTRKRLDSLRGYLTSHFAAQNLHNRAWLLWASSGMDGLLTSSKRIRLIDQLLAKQQPGGGWSLGSLGDFTHVEIKTPSTAADGYATGLVLHALQLAGISKDHPRVRKGLAWLRANQDPTGAWRALSVNKPREPESKNASKANIGKFMWDAATGYAVLALSH